MKPVHCVGLVLVDALGAPLGGRAAPRSVEEVAPGAAALHPGGGAANAAAALAQMGIPAAVFAKVGDDATARFALAALGRYGVDTSGVRLAGGEATAFSYVEIGPDGEHTFRHTPGANGTFGAADLDRRAVLDTDLLFYSDFCALPGLDGGPAAELLAQARSRGAVTFLDAAGRIGPDAAAWEIMLPHADYALPGYRDLRRAYGGCRPDEMVRRLRDRGAGCVVLKLGRRGCLVDGSRGMVHVPSAADRIVDTTGAGDCFDAGFIAGIAHGLDPAGAAGVGSRSAAACIRHVGASAGIPPLAELLAGAGQVSPSVRRDTCPG